MGNFQSAKQGIFQSAEHSAMHDIYKEQSGIARNVIEQAKKERARDKAHLRMTGWWQKSPHGYDMYIPYRVGVDRARRGGFEGKGVYGNPYRTSRHYIQAYWYSHICDYINDNFIGAESLATPESRKLNRELGLHKVNKTN